jgi:hypothetical protein
VCGEREREREREGLGERERDRERERVHGKKGEESAFEWVFPMVDLLRSRKLKPWN